MLDAVKLEQLKQASLDGDWTTASDTALEISLESKKTPDAILVDSQLHAVQARDSEWLAMIAAELAAPETER